MITRFNIVMLCSLASVFTACGGNTPEAEEPKAAVAAERAEDAADETEVNTERAEDAADEAEGSADDSEDSADKAEKAADESSE
jgi:hypothetical protein